MFVSQWHQHDSTVFQNPGITFVRKKFLFFFLPQVLFFDFNSTPQFRNRT